MEGDIDPVMKQYFSVSRFYLVESDPDSERVPAYFTFRRSLLWLVVHGVVVHWRTRGELLDVKVFCGRGLDGAVVDRNGG